MRKGGHSIPDDGIERRYGKGIQNVSKYAQKADNWYLYDNSLSEYILIAKCIEGEQEIFNFKVFTKFMQI